MSRLRESKRALPAIVLALALLALQACAGAPSAVPAALAASKATAPGPCTDFERDVERVWNTQRKTEVTAAFIKLGVDSSDRVVERVITKMDDIAADWVMLSERVCKDYLIRKAISQREYAARTACIDSALVRQRTFARMLATPTKGYAARAFDAFEEISNKLDECQSEALWAVYALDASVPAAQRERAEALSSETLLATALGDGARAEQAALQAVEVAEGSGNARLVIDSLLASALVDIRSARYVEAATKLGRATAQARGLGAQLSLALAFQYSGQLQHERHAYQQAVAAYEEALTLRRALLPATHPLIAWTLDNLGAAYRSLGDPRRAIALHEQALAIYRKNPDAPGSRVSDALSNLGLAWAELGDAARAVQYYEEALALDHPKPSDDRPAIATTLNNLGLAYRELGDSERATEACKRALEIFRAAYGERHPGVARALRSLGSIALREADYPRARALLQQAVDVAADDDPGRADALNDLGMAWGMQADYARAAAFFEQALALRLQLATSSALELADTSSNLGVALARAEQPARAVEALNSALARYRAALGPHDAHVIDTLEQLGFVYQQLGDCAQARRVLLEALGSSRATSGEQAPHTQHLQMEVPDCSTR